MTNNQANLKNTNDLIFFRNRFKGEKVIITERNVKIKRIPLAKTKGSVTVIDSSLGTGKTTVVSEYVKNTPHARIVYVAPSISLSLTASKKFELDFYLDKGKARPVGYQRLSVCCNSLMQVDVMNCDILILDEPDQILSMLLGSTIKESDRKQIMDQLVNLVSNATTVFIMQHNITDGIKTILKRANRLDDVRFYENKYQPWKHVKTKFVSGIYTSALGKFSTQFQELLDSKTKFAVACNSKRKIRELGSMIEKMGGKCLTIHLDNATEKAQELFFKHPTETSEHYDCIIYSPKVTSGVSIENPEYTHTFGIFINGENSLSPDDFVQMLGRNRCLQNLHVWVSKSELDLPTSNEGVMKTILDVQKLQIQFIKTDNSSMVEFKPYEITWIDKLRLGHKLFKHTLKNNAYHSIKNALIELGCKTEDESSTKQEREKGKKMNSENQNARIEEDLATVLPATDISDKEYFALSKKNEITLEQAHQLKKYVTQKNLGIKFDELNDDERKKQYKYAEESFLPNKCRLWETSSLSDHIIKTSIRKMVASDRYPLTASGTLFVKHKVLKGLMEQIGVTYDKGDISFKSENRFKISDICNSSLGKFLTANKEVVNECGLGGRIAKKVTGKVIGLWLKNMGIEIQAVAVRSNGKFERKYFIKKLTDGLQEVAKNRYNAKTSFQFTLKQQVTKKALNTTSTPDELAYILGVQQSRESINFITKNFQKMLPETIAALLTDINPQPKITHPGIQKNTQVSSKLVCRI